MKPIGGYFEWEFSTPKNSGLHGGAVYLNSGRHALEYILKGLGNVRTLWIPYFTCEVVLEPLQKLGIAWKFYHIDERLEIANAIDLQDGEYLLYTNYYGIKDAYVHLVVKGYGERVIIDNAQALYCSAVAAHQFYSPRKYLGMPDGGIAVTSVPDYSASLPQDKSFDRCSHLLKRLESAPSEGFNDFKENSRKIESAPLSKMSAISHGIFTTVDLESVKRKRKENFERMHDALGASNRLDIPSKNDYRCPLVYPLLLENGNELKKKLIAQSVFVATYWPNVFEWCKPMDLEYKYAKDILPLPVDQRYGEEEMEFIIKEI